MTLPDIVKKFRDDRKTLANEFLSNEDVFGYLKKHSEAADSAVTEILKIHRLSDRVAVVAVGGYGREQQFPFSDLDLLFLIPDGVQDHELKTISDVIADLWSLGLTVGYSVRSIEECLNQAAADITAQTAMLESRLISGDSELFEKYLDEMEKSLDLKKFYRAKFIEQEQRHIKYHESSYALEPNIKESPGGLRDLNILIWILRAAHLGKTWEEVRLAGLITERECRLLESVTESLYRLRIHMHLLANRHEDRLIFEIQEPLAKVLKIHAETGRRPSEVMMQKYYLNAKTIGQLNSIILAAVKERFSNQPELAGVPLSKGFIRRGDVLDLETKDVFVQNPELITEAFLIQERHPDIPMKSSRLYRALFHAHSLMSKGWAESQDNKDTFLKIIQGRRGVWHALEEMNRWGVLGKLLPNFERIVGQMQHDLFHAYTVDQHTLLAIRFLRNFTHSENAHEMPLCTELMMAMKGSWRLVLALLYHDIGKGSGKDHSVLGAEIVRKTCKDFGLSPQDSDFIEFLVREHLTMSMVAQKQDTADPEVVANFARKVGSMDRLIGLYLLTVCDIRATGPKIWNAWKAQLLEDLFYASARFLKGKGIDRNLLVSRRRADALRLTRFTPEQREAINRFWDNFDVAYFMKHSVRNIVWHAKVLLPHLGRQESFVTSRPLKGMEHAHEILILTQDCPELFARIVSSLQQFGLSIAEARIHTGTDGRVVDSFIVVDDGSDPQFDKELLRIQRELAERLNRREKLGPPIRGRLSRQSKLFPISPSASLRPDAAGKQYMLSIVATDRLGLLASVSRVFVTYGINLVTARITTLGERAEDIFLIEHSNLSDPNFCAEFEKSVLEVLEPV